MWQRTRVAFEKGGLGLDGLESTPNPCKMGARVSASWK